MTTTSIIKHLSFLVLSILLIFVIASFMELWHGLRLYNALIFGFLIFPFYSLMKVLFCFICTLACFFEEKGILKSWSQFEEKMVKKYSWKK